jgi:hypothetical protein
MSDRLCIIDLSLHCLRVMNMLDMSLRNNNINECEKHNRLMYDNDRYDPYFISFRYIKKTGVFARWLCQRIRANKWEKNKSGREKFGKNIEYLENLHNERRRRIWPFLIQPYSLLSECTSARICSINQYFINTQTF